MGETYLIFWGVHLTTTSWNFLTDDKSFSWGKKFTLKILYNDLIHTLAKVMTRRPQPRKTSVHSFLFSSSHAMNLVDFYCRTHANHVCSPAVNLIFFYQHGGSTLQVLLHTYSQSSLLVLAPYFRSFGEIWFRAVHSSPVAHTEISMWCFHWLL